MPPLYGSQAQIIYIELNDKLIDRRGWIRRSRLQEHPNLSTSNLFYFNNNSDSKQVKQAKKDVQQFSEFGLFVI